MEPNKLVQRWFPGWWIPMKYAPKNGAWIEVEFVRGTRACAHWAEDLSGSEQPPFKGWFRKHEGCQDYYQCSPMYWRPLIMAKPRSENVEVQQ